VIIMVPLHRIMNLDRTKNPNAYCNTITLFAGSLRSNVKIYKLYTYINVVDLLIQPLPQPKHVAHMCAISIKYLHD
jgi:hypothetical protein